MELNSRITRPSVYTVGLPAKYLLRIHPYIYVRSMPYITDVDSIDYKMLYNPNLRWVVNIKDLPHFRKRICDLDICSAWKVILAENIRVISWNDESFVKKPKQLDLDNENFCNTMGSTTRKELKIFLSCTQSSRWNLRLNIRGNQPNSFKPCPGAENVTDDSPYALMKPEVDHLRTCIYCSEAVQDIAANDPYHLDPRGIEKVLGYCKK